MTVTLHRGDVLKMLAKLPADSVHCIVTSPPYWGLRDYGVDGQLGLESTIDEYVAKIVEVGHALRRVLRPDGVMFWNHGDCYASGSGGDRKIGEHDETRARCRPPEFGLKASPTNNSTHSGNVWQGAEYDQPFRSKRYQNQPSPRTIGSGLKHKDLVGQPWRVAFALQADGWYLRSDIIWAKPNPMPESVTDRPTKAHEYVFLLTKSAKYFWDQESVRESATGRDPGNISIHKHDDGTMFNRTKSGLAKITAATERNIRTVWTIATHAFPDAHFATFPPKLVETCINAGCPKGGTVLDPFAGSGTTLLVADRLQRTAIGIDLNTKYAEMAVARIEKDQGGLFADVAVI